jgi:hypothetical protein
MKSRTLALLVCLTTGLSAADVPSFEFKSQVFPLPPLKLGDGLIKPPTLMFSSPALPAPADRFRPAARPSFNPQMRIVKPRSDIEFKMIVKEPDPNLDPKFVIPSSQPPAAPGAK